MSFDPHTMKIPLDILISIFLTVLLFPVHYDNKNIWSNNNALVSRPKLSQNISKEFCWLAFYCKTIGCENNSKDLAEKSLLQAPYVRSGRQHNGSSAKRGASFQDPFDAFYFKASWSQKALIHAEISFGKTNCIKSISIIKNFSDWDNCSAHCVVFRMWCMGKEEDCFEKAGKSSFFFLWEKI